MKPLLSLIAAFLAAANALPYGLCAYVFGRDGGLTKVDILERRIARRILQAGNSIGGAISQDGSLVAAQNYQPGGVKVFDADTLDLLADIPATYGDGQQRSKVVGLADVPGNKFAYALFDAGEIWVADLSTPREPKVTKFRNVGSQFSRCRICVAGRWPADAPTCPPSAGTKSWWSIPLPGRKSAASR